VKDLHPLALALSGLERRLLTTGVVAVLFPVSNILLQLHGGTISRNRSLVMALALALAS
jgi:hypothetical protein